MVDQLSIVPTHETIEALSVAVKNEDCRAIAELLKPLNPAEIAHLADALPAKYRPCLLKCISDGLDGEVLLHMGENAASELVEEMDTDALQQATESMDTADVAELLEEVLDKDAGEDLLESMDAQRRERIELNLSFDENTAGRLMHTDAISVRADVTLEAVQRYLRRIDKVPEDTNVLMVVDRDNHFLGAISLLNLVLHADDKLVDEVMEKDWRTINPEMLEQEVTRIFANHDWFSAPVVDDSGRFLGRIVVDDVIDSIREEADRAMLSPVGLDEDEDLFAPILPSASRRAVWLAINLATAFLASWVIGLFEATIAEVVALAVLMPIVASMGGIAGSQTLTLTIRGLAMGHVVDSNTRWLLKKEIAIGFINGVLWASVVSLVTFAWFQSVDIALIIGAALIVNMVVAAAAGIIVPLALQKMNIDPAISGAVVLTTVTDVIGFMAFLGLASIFLI